MAFFVFCEFHRCCSIPQLWGYIRFARIAPCYSCRFQKHLSLRICWDNSFWKHKCSRVWINEQIPVAISYSWLFSLNINIQFCNRLFGLSWNTSNQIECSGGNSKGIDGLRGDWWGFLFPNRSWKCEINEALQSNRQTIQQQQIIRGAINYIPWDFDSCEESMKWIRPSIFTPFCRGNINEELIIRGRVESKTCTTDSIAILNIEYPFNKITVKFLK